MIIKRQKEFGNKASKSKKLSWERAEWEKAISSGNITKGGNITKEAQIRSYLRRTHQDAMKEKAKSIAAMGNKDYYKLLLNVAKENEPAVRKLKRIAQNRVRI